MNHVFSCIATRFRHNKPKLRPGHLAKPKSHYFGCTALIKKTHTTSGAGQPAKSATVGGYVLITGATGLVGQYLLKELYLAGESKIAVIVRPSKKLDVRQRVELILQKWEAELGSLLPRPVIFQGDVAEPDLGLEIGQIDWIRQHVDRMIHSAAVLQFSGPDRSGEPWRTNLGGTRNVIELTKQVEIDHLHYVSTAYVCGVREEKILECDLDEGQEFRNDYEQSKFESESLVRAAEHLKTKTVYRPAVIVGDSETGFTSTYHGLFLYLRLLATLVPEQQTNSDGTHITPIRLPFRGDEPRNLVPVNWVSAVIGRLFCDPTALGKTFHLVPDKFTTARQVIDFCCEYFNSAGVEYSDGSSGRVGDNDFATRFFENAKIYESYETSDPVFDCQNLKHHAGDLVCPEIDREAIERFMKFGQKDAWGKRRHPAPPIEFDCNENLSLVLAVTLEMAAKAELGESISIDVKGPGGGQWHIAEEDGKTVMKDGLLAGQSVIETSAGKLKSLAATLT